MPQAVLVTGASSGIGRASARLFAERGAQVFGTSRNPQPDQDGVAMLRLDAADPESVRQCVDQVLDRAGRIDVLVNNAGTMHQGMAEETTQARIVTVGSLAAVIGEPGEGY